MYSMRMAVYICCMTTVTDPLSIYQTGFSPYIRQFYLSIHETDAAKCAFAALCIGILRSGNLNWARYGAYRRVTFTNIVTNPCIDE